MRRHPLADPDAGPASRRPQTVDAHQHFWDPDLNDLSWLTGRFAAIHRPFGPDDLAPLLTGLGIDRTILVQSDGSVAETEHLLQTAERTAFVAGVVGWVDLAAPGVAGTIRALRAGPGGVKLVGIRYALGEEPDPGWILRPDVRRGVQALGQEGLACDLLVGPPELAAVLAAIRSHPDVRFVIDHLGRPPIREGALEPWASLIRPFGELRNVWCKVSGLVTQAEWSGWLPEDLVPFVRHALTVFGPDRLMFGSDWPVCLLAASYEEVHEAAELALNLSDQDHAAVFGGNAIEAYAIDQTA